MMMSQTGCCEKRDSGISKTKSKYFIAQFTECDKEIDEFSHRFHRVIQTLCILFCENPCLPAGRCASVAKLFVVHRIILTNSSATIFLYALVYNYRTVCRADRATTQQ